MAADIAPPNCFIGFLLNEECHRTTYGTIKELIPLCNIQNYNLCLLEIRIPNFNRNVDSVVCKYHYDRYLNYYSAREYKCCVKHSSIRRGNLKIITLELATRYKKIHNSWSLIPGKKLCPVCYNDVLLSLNPEKVGLEKPEDSFNMTEDSKNQFPKKVVSNSQIENFVEKYYVKNEIVIPSNNENEINNRTGTQSSSSSGGSLYLTESQEKLKKGQKLSDLLEIVDVSPPKKQKLSTVRFQDQIVRSFVPVLHNKVVGEISKVYEVNLNHISNFTQIYDNNLSFLSLIENLLVKFNSEIKVEEKIRLLTLLPDHWSYVEVKRYFDCTRYMYTKAAKLKQVHGEILKLIFIIIR